jgi:tryptophan synthase alpha chain
MTLDSYIRERLQHKRLLLMTHIVIGYPSYRESFELALAMVEAGVDLMELQIPFSEPMADGPVILAANQAALERGATVARAFELARDLSQRVVIPLLFMTYYNLVFRRGVARFASDSRQAGVCGAIVPDLPPEEGRDYENAMRAEGLDPILIVAPNTPDERLRLLARRASGMLYCVARKGVTGASTDFSDTLTGHLARVRAATDLPRAVGFGIKRRADVDFLVGKAEVAVVGSESLRVLDASGIQAAVELVRGLSA